MNSQMVFGLIRHLLTSLGGVLIAKGYTDPTGLESIVGGVTTIIGVAWSMYHKKATPTD